MSMHFCSRSWEVRDVEDGTSVTITQRDLDATSIPVLVEDLFELVLESGRPNLYLDFSDVRLLPSVVMGKLIALDTKLHGYGGRLVVSNLDPVIYKAFQATRLCDVLDVRSVSMA